MEGLSWSQVLVVAPPVWLRRVLFSRCRSLRSSLPRRRRARSPGWAFTALPEQMDTQHVVAADDWVVSREVDEPGTAVAYRLSTGETHTFTAPAHQSLWFTSLSGNTVVGRTVTDTGQFHAVFVYDLAARTMREVDVTNAHPVAHHGDRIVVQDETTGRLSVHDVATGRSRGLPAIPQRWYNSHDVLVDDEHVVGTVREQVAPYTDHLFIYSLDTDTVREISVDGQWMRTSDLHDGVITGSAARGTFDVPVTATSGEEVTVAAYPTNDATFRVTEMSHRWLLGYTVTQYPLTHHEYVYDRADGVQRPLYTPPGLSSNSESLVPVGDSLVGSVYDRSEGTSQLGLWRATEQVGLTSVTVKNPKQSVLYGWPGDTLTSTLVGLSPANARVTYQWVRDGVPIRGATGATRKLNLDDVGKKVSLEVTATAPGHAPRTVTSPNVTVGKGPLPNVTKASIVGTPKVGNTLTVRPGTWSPSPTSYTQEWYRENRKLRSATGTTCKVTAADRGHRIRVVVWANRDGYHPGYASAKSSTVKSGTIRAATPKLSGTPKVGSTLRLSRGSWSPSSVKFTQQWYRNSYPIPGATGTYRKLTSADRGARIHVRVTARKSGYTTTSRVTAQTSAVRR